MVFLHENDENNPLKGFFSLSSSLVLAIILKNKSTFLEVWVAFINLSQLKRMWNNERLHR